MNIRRGLFRFWVLVSLLWIAVIGTFNWDRLVNPSLAPANYRYFPLTQTFVKVGDTANYPEPEPPATATYEIENNTIIYAPKGGKIEEMRPRFVQFYKTIESERQAILWKARWNEAKGASLVAFGGPLLLLLAGACLVWAISGFLPVKPRTPSQP